jgi:carboxylesterase type B
VYFFIQGGGFNSNSNANFNGSGLLLAANLDLVVVTFNYRVGPYGFLASEAVREDGDLNAGLLDQRKALGWVNQHISKVCMHFFFSSLVSDSYFTIVRR